MSSLSSSIGVLRILVAQDYSRTPAYLVRTRFERALLALGSDVASEWYATDLDRLTSSAVDAVVHGHHHSDPRADALLADIVGVFDEFLQFVDVDEYSTRGRHRNIALVSKRVTDLCDRIEVAERDMAP